MKRVEVFTINRNSEMLPAVGRDFEFLRYGALQEKFVNLDAGAVRDMNSDRKFAPIERICKNITGTSGQVTRLDQYIVIEPELRELLTVKERQEIDELRAEVHHLNKVTQTQQHEVSSWWSQPWYVRVWLSIRGEK